MKVVKAPFFYSESPRPWVFLCGSIDMGAAENWQQRVQRELAKYPGTILNPRRDDWDSSWVQSKDNPQFREQVTWELAAQEESNFILVYFDSKTKSSITLLELGLFGRSTLGMTVCCADGYWRKGNVDLVCERYGIHTVRSIEDMIIHLKNYLVESNECIPQK